MKGKIQSRSGKANLLGRQAKEHESAIRNIWDEVFKSKKPITIQQKIQVAYHQQMSEWFRSEERRFNLSAKYCGDEMLVIS